MLNVRRPIKALPEKSEVISGRHRALAPGLRIARSAIDGKGVFATRHFQQYQQVAEYVGEKITLAEAERRRLEPGKKSICDVDLDWSIDGRYGGNGTEYINHSCDPNCYVAVLDGRIFLYATRDIAAGEELTTSYRYELEREGGRCRCDSLSCVESRKRRITG
jgi:SET domain-containing protein